MDEYCLKDRPFTRRRESRQGSWLIRSETEEASSVDQLGLTSVVDQKVARYFRRRQRVDAREMTFIDVFKTTSMREVLVSRSRNKLAKSLMPSVMVLTSFLFSCSVFGGSDAEIVSRKADSSLKHWEYSGAEFERLVKLSESERTALVSLLDTTEIDDERALQGLTMLAALNCVAVENDSSTRWLHGYLCSDVKYERFVERAVQSLDSIYMLSFVKESDRSRALDFLRPYIDLLKTKAFVSGEDLEYLEEIYMYVGSRPTGTEPN